MPTCPICKTITNQKFQEDTPYWMCPHCNLLYQDPLPKKVYESSGELDAQGNSTGHLMSEHDKAVNAYLAKSVFERFMQSKPGKVLGVGVKFPYFEKCLKDLGCEAYGIDGVEVVNDYVDLLTGFVFTIDVYFGRRVVTNDDDRQARLYTVRFL